MRIKVITPFSELTKRINNSPDCLAEAIQFIVDDCISYEMRVSDTGSNACNDDVWDDHCSLDLAEKMHLSDLHLDGENEALPEDECRPCGIQILIRKVHLHEAASGIDDFFQRIYSVHQRLGDAGFGLCMTGYRQFDNPMVIYGLKDSAALAHHVAQIAHMPKDTVFHYDPDIGPFIALHLDDALLDSCHE